jgi:hypothetical protein
MPSESWLWSASTALARHLGTMRQHDRQTRLSRNTNQRPLRTRDVEGVRDFTRPRGTTFERSDRAWKVRPALGAMDTQRCSSPSPVEVGAGWSQVARAGRAQARRRRRRRPAPAPHLSRAARCVTWVPAARTPSASVLRRAFSCPPADPPKRQRAFRGQGRHRARAEASPQGDRGALQSVVAHSRSRLGDDGKVVSAPGTAAA